MEERADARARPNEASDGRVWGVTAYFNPSGYRRRLSSYSFFRRTLAIPLVTVELSYDAGFELKADDAEVLIQLRGRDVMFQKERLLNLAIDAVPESCAAIAWLDCDVVFTDPSWSQRALEALDQHTLVQPFDRFEEPGPDWVPGQPNPGLVNEARSWAWHFVHRTMPEDRLSQDLRFAGCVTGGAWIARRQFLAEHKLYDACVVGSGVRCPPAAGIGRPEYAARYMRFNQAWNDHYQRWADPFSHAVESRVGYVDGTLCHLWHGDLKKRRYAEIHREFERFHFDPRRDIRVNTDGCFEWDSAKPGMHRFVRDYFDSRREDTVPEQS